LLLQDLEIKNGRVITKDQKREINFQGLLIVIENEKGSIRQWEHDGEKGETKMIYPYGFIKGSLGKDGEGVDCFVGDDKYVPNTYMIYSTHTKGFDTKEEKVMLGFDSKESASEAYLLHYNDQKFLGEVVELPMYLFKETLEYK